MPAAPEARANLEGREPGAFREAAKLHPFAEAASSASCRSVRPSLSILRPSSAMYSHRALALSQSVSRSTSHCSGNLGRTSEFSRHLGRPSHFL